MPFVCLQATVVNEREEQEETDTTTEHIVKAIYSFKGADADEVGVGVSGGCVPMQCMCVHVCVMWSVGSLSPLPPHS